MRIIKLSYEILESLAAALAVFAAGACGCWGQLLVDWLS